MHYSLLILSRLYFDCCCGNKLGSIFLPSLKIIVYWPPLCQRWDFLPISLKWVILSYRNTDINYLPVSITKRQEFVMTLKLILCLFFIMQISQQLLFGLRSYEIQILPFPFLNLNRN